jgi:urate oxidase
MAVLLGDNQYGKAETRLVRIDRAGERHRITDLSVTTTLAGDLVATHTSGDNAGVLPTDSQKNAVFAFARDGVGERAVRLGPEGGGRPPGAALVRPHRRHPDGERHL